ncbi:uncharacterized protein PHALS_10609 [Plasmopara halstedii]|uniref:Uncharacterized protein n=1 Tax=Plasmopara halstedii TaxID=4781 RepID=A0A0P1AIN6_PLAHL|nr:uncharacterized protein PHALS_10609 [Plasmopara halstedii]CEG40408.1 hypothetical protein PHALS_10609 [Plasmopara halstedii]|eukprot:XP_024576777.1 hypothetical protein PHALS_10609 [Plasmopara halstedii]
MRDASFQHRGRLNTAYSSALLQITEECGPCGLFAEEYVTRMMVHLNIALLSLLYPELRDKGASLAVRLANFYDR